jgi:hypothetical protein
MLANTSRLEPGSMGLLNVQIFRKAFAEDDFSLLYTY